MIGIWDYRLNKENKVRAIAIDFPKAIDKLNHNSCVK